MTIFIFFLVIFAAVILIFVCLLIALICIFRSDERSECVGCEYFLDTGDICQECLTKQRHVNQTLKNDGRTQVIYCGNKDCKHNTKGKCKLNDMDPNECIFEKWRLED